MDNPINKCRDCSYDRAKSKDHGYVRLAAPKILVKKRKVSVAKVMGQVRRGKHPQSGRQRETNQAHSNQNLNGAESFHFDCT